MTSPRCSSAAWCHPQERTRRAAGDPGPTARNQRELVANLERCIGVPGREPRRRGHRPARARAARAARQPGTSCAPTAKRSACGAASNHLPLLWKPFSSWRAAMFRMAEVLGLRGGTAGSQPARRAAGRDGQREPQGGVDHRRGGHVLCLGALAQAGAPLAWSLAIRPTGATWRSVFSAT
jgi:hypothetical protein